jgi:hypothetical protein
MQIKTKISLFSIILLLFIFSPAITLAVSDVDVVGNVTGTGVIPTPSNPPSYTAPFSISNILVKEISTDSANVLWETNEEAICKVFWGKSADYELGSISEEMRKLNHSTIIPDLSASTTYHFKISCKNRSGQEIESSNQKFITLSIEKKVPPPEVSFFESIPGDSQIELKWGNPKPASFKGVRIIRSIQKYPQTPFDEVLIYDSSGDSFVDKSLINGVTYYYSIFTYDKYGNYSSGSFVFGVPKAEEKKPEEVTGKIEIPKEIVPQIPEAIIRGRILELTDFVFSQDGKIQPFDGDVVTLKSERPFNISIVRDKIPLEAKNIVITIFQPNPLSITFQYDAVKKEFIAIDPSIDKVGEYYFVIQVINENGEVFAFAMGKIKVEQGISKPIINPPKSLEEWVGLLINKLLNYSSFFPQFIAIFIIFLMVVFLKNKKR